MFGTKKRKGLTWFAIISLTLVGCQDELPKGKVQFILGEAQGTTYQVLFGQEQDKVFKEDIDSILQLFDDVLSTYQEKSIISQLNGGTKSIQDSTFFFKQCYLDSKSVFEKTNGLFDPTVYPLVEGWGFMKDMGSPLSQNEVDSILQFVGMEKQNILFSGTLIRQEKLDERIKLDFNSIAQGYAVDVVANYLKKKRIDDFFVEIGGEIYVHGRNKENKNWSIGIDVPKENLEQREIENIVRLTNRAIATSGNYRKFYEVNGKKYAHSLNPKTGFPVEHNLLSATVIAPTTALADAYATAFMVMGTEKSLEFIETHPELNLEIYLLSDGENGIERAMSDGFAKFIDE